MAHTVLTLPFFITGHYFQYDGIVYPETQELSRFTRAYKFVTRSNEDKLEVPNHDQAQREALYIFLQGHQNALQQLEISTPNNKMDFLKFANGVYHIFLQLFCLKIFHHQRRDTYPASSLTKVHLIRV